MTDHTQSILDLLEILRKKEIASKEPFKAKAYLTVIKNITSLDRPIYSMEDFEGVKGVGEKIRLKLVEFFETGRMKAADNASNNVNTQIMQSLMNVHGIGPSKAKSLVEDNGIKSIENLEQNTDLLNDKQKMGLRYYKHFMERIPRKEMEVHRTLISNIISSVDAKFTFEVTGSFRRGMTSSGDIDILITHKDDPSNVEELFKSIVSKMKSFSYITDVFAEGGKKCLAVCRLKRYKHFRRIDLLYTNKKEYPFALLYFTGDASFNIAMRNHCLARGYSLSEHGIKDEKSGRNVDIVMLNEQDIFEFVGLKYVEPKDRTSNAVVSL
jgi:DNA polymerase/3'-5' exonuclease PolX